MIVRLTKRVVDALVPGQTVYDTEVHGFGVRCGTRYRSYHLKCFIRGRQRWLTIGKHGSPWTVELARKRAIELLVKVHNGIDPGDEKRKGSKTTIAQLAERYLADHAIIHKRPLSVRLDKTNIRHHVVPLLGKYCVDEISKSDLMAFQRDVFRGKSARISTLPVRHGNAVRGGPVVANRCLTLLSKMFALAEDWGIRSVNSNPARGIKPFPESRRERFLSTDEFARLGAALRRVEQEKKPFIVAAFRLLVLTGARLTEIQTLQWEWVDLDRGMLLLPISKTGHKVIRLSAPAVAILRKLPRLANNPYVIPGAGRSYYKNLHPVWADICKAAQLSNVRIHDLRHTFASVAAAQGKSLQVIGALLGHGRAETTERYAHLRSDDVAEANAVVGNAISMMLNEEVGHRPARKR